MRAGASRALNAAELGRLSAGLAIALEQAGAAPVIVSRVHPAARLAGLWRGSAPILARPGRIFWPGAPADFALAPAGVFATLQHELQHLLEYATGELTAVGYLTRPAHWRYDYALDGASRWSDFGAEQRASIAEHLWLVEQGRSDLVRGLRSWPPPGLEIYRRVVPWAAPRLP